MTPLGELIEQRRQALGLTWYDVQSRGGFGSHTIGYGIAHAKSFDQVPQTKTLDRLAKALDLPTDLVRHTAAASISLVPLVGAAERDARIAAHDMCRMNPEQRQEMVRLAHEMTEPN